MMSQKLSDISENPVERGSPSIRRLGDPPPARDPAETKSWVSVTTDGSLEIQVEDDAERRRRHSHAERGNE